MKTVTQKDFQNLYKSPEYEQTEEMRRTLARLPEKKKTDWGTVFGKRRVAIILVAAMMLIGIAAIAVTGPSSILVNWGAKQTEEVKSATEIRAEELSEKMLEIIKNAPDDVRLEIVADPGLGGEKPIQKTVNSMEEMLQDLEAAGYPHPDRLIPEGWSFRSAWLDYDCDSEGTYKLVSETVQDGMTVQQYTLDEEHRVLCGYRIAMEKGSKKAQIESSYASRTITYDMSFGFPADEETKVVSKTVSVPGMEKALFVSYGDETFLHMYRKLETPVSFGEKVNTKGLAEETAVALTEPCSYEMIMCRGLEPEEAASLFAGNP